MQEDLATEATQSSVAGTSGLVCSHLGRKDTEGASSRRYALSDPLPLARRQSQRFHLLPQTALQAGEHVLKRLNPLEHIFKL